MIPRIVLACFCIVALGLAPARADLPEGFVRLKDVDASIIQDIRYSGSYNFTGKPVPGYEKPECILRREAAAALAAAQKDISAKGYALKVFDCFRPKSATRAFVAWAGDGGASGLDQEFHPGKTKAQLFKEGYISDASSHSLGVAVDLTIVRPTDIKVTRARGGGACDGPADIRPMESTLDFGTTFDCFSDKSHTQNASISQQARENRKLLVDVMAKNGFKNYRREWWHFQLVKVPAGAQPADFPVK